MPLLSDLRSVINRRPWLRAIVLIFAWPVVLWRRRTSRIRRELYEQAVACPAYGEVAVPVHAIEGTFLVDIRSDILRRLIFSGRYAPGAIEAVR
jgi:hypothetical protein